MQKAKRPVLINLAIVVGLLLFDVSYRPGSNPRAFIDRPFSDLFFSGTFILLLAPINFVIGMVRNRNRKGDGHYYFLIAGVLLLIGFSVCSISV